MSTPRALEDTTRDNPLDLLIVGAGLSGIDMAHHVNENLPDWEWRIVDSNSAVGGTWVTFTYPGIRSDSDMATFSLPFKRWPHKGSLGSGVNIQRYVAEAAEDERVPERLDLSTWVKSAAFHSGDDLWEVTMVTRADGKPLSEGHIADGDSPQLTERTAWARRLHFASGYYKHHAGFTATIPGLDNFAGEVIHPQSWPESIEISGRKFVIIGSGATAITLLPALHEMGADATMLQRTPSYVAPLMNVDNISAVSHAVLPDKYAGNAARAAHIFRDMAQYWMCQLASPLARMYFWGLQRAFIPGKTIKEHFTPPYDPWDQRVCKSPDGDFFKAMQGGAKVVTGKIESVEAKGIRLIDGRFINADVILTATGLDIQVFGGAEITVDGEPMDPAGAVAYRGMMFDRVPNLSMTVGYLNQSWTLRADLVSRYMVRLWQEAEKYGYSRYEPQFPLDEKADRPLLDMESGYLLRARDRLPVQTDRDPWAYEQDYIAEYRSWGKPNSNLRADMIFS